MPGKELTKIEVNLPLNVATIKTLAAIANLFTQTQGIGGCTYSTSSKPTPIKGEWRNEKGDIIKDDIVWIYGCYDILEAKIDVEVLIKHVKEMIEKEAGEDLAWITYSNVCILTS